MPCSDLGSELQVTLQASLPNHCFAAPHHLALVHLLQDFVDEIPTPELVAQDQRNQKAAVLESAIAEQEWGLHQVAPLLKSVVARLRTGWSRNPPHRLHCQ